MTPKQEEWPHNMISIIVAVDDKRGIGKSTNAANQGMLWHISEDFKRFKGLTTGHPIIMGRKTHEMIGKVLPNRPNIIITRDTNYKVEGAEIVDSLEKAIEIGQKKEQERLSLRGAESDVAISMPNTEEEEIFIIGGGQIFKEAMEKGIVDKLYLTLVKGDYSADIFFPEYEKQFPKIMSEETKSEGEYTYTFINREK